MRVEGYSYIGMGNSTNKKDAQSNAARDFVNYLVRMKEISPGEVPALGVSITSVLTTAHLLCVMRKVWVYVSHFQACVPDGGSEEGGGGGGGEFGNLPSNCPLPPHLAVKKEIGEKLGINPVIRY